MKELRVYLIQYVKKENRKVERRLNRFYANQKALDYDRLNKSIYNLIAQNKNLPLDEIANSVEEKVLKRRKFVGIWGLKRILPSYESILSYYHIHKIEINN